MVSIVLLLEHRERPTEFLPKAFGTEMVKRRVCSFLGRHKRIT